jgi:hypothetical protein
MSTTSQIIANQQNAQLSTGPVTEAGKAISSRNNLRHGLASGMLIIEGEDPAEYQALLDSYLAEHNPTTPTEIALVVGLAQHEWMGDRALSFQSHCFARIEVDEKQLNLFIRYEATHRRAYDKCLNNLLKLRKEKRQEQIGFESQKRQQAEEIRRQEAHQAKMRLTHARAQQQEIDSDIRQTIEARSPATCASPSTP